MPALAQNYVSWVASFGDDVNSCTHASPCRSFQRAHDMTNNNGVVKAIDAENYGPVTIGKPITIDGTGSGAFIDTNAAGITINTGLAKIIGLTIHAPYGI